MTDKELSDLLIPLPVIATTDSMVVIKEVDFSTWSNIREATEFAVERETTNGVSYLQVQISAGKYFIFYED